METEDLIKIIIQCAYQVRLHLAPGFLESVYQKALVLELKERGIYVETEIPIKIYYKNTIVGEFKADIIVENTIIIGLKAVQSLVPAHEAQLVNYLTATRIDNGLLINFGGERIEIKRKFRLYKQTTKKNNQNDYQKSIPFCFRPSVLYVLLFFCLKNLMSTHSY